jgi:putative hydrolase of the HAD superfamily
VSISFIWFDLGYTLLYQQREAPYRAVLAELGHEVTRERLELEFHLADKRFMREYPGVFGGDPETFAPWFLGVLNHRLGIRTDLCRTWQMLKRTSAHGPAGVSEGHAGWLPFDGAADALADLRRRGYRLGVITNWDPSARGILAAHGLDGYFEQVVVSCEAGCEKPEPRIFEIATGAAQVAPAACLYVGDNYYVDTVGARAAGMASVVVNRFGRQGVEEITDVPIIAHVREIAGWLETTGA